MLESQIQIGPSCSAFHAGWQTRGSDYQNSAPKSPFDLLDSRGTEVSLRRGQVIYSEGEDAKYFYKLVSGSVRTVKLLSDGRRQVCEFLLPGEILGLDSRNEYYFSAEAVTKTRLMRYARRSVEALIEEDPIVAQKVRVLASHDLQVAYERMVLMCHKSAQQRVAWFLLDMANRSGTSNEGFVLLPMTRADVADYLGMALETVSRAISHLKRKGIISLENVNKITFLNRNLLERACGEV